MQDTKTKSKYKIQSKEWEIFTIKSFNDNNLFWQ